MGIVEIVLLLALLCGNIQARNVQNQKDFQDSDDNQGLCVQEEGQEDCVACLERSQGCYWCYSDDNFQNGECRSAHACPDPDQQWRTCGNSHRDKENDNSYQGYDKKSEQYNHDNEPRKHDYKVQPRKYDHEIQHKISDYDFQPRKYSHEIQPRKYNHANQPRNYNQKNRPGKYDHGNQPGKYNNENQPRRYNHENQPQKYNHENQPGNYDYDNQPGKFNYENKPRKYNHGVQNIKYNYNNQPQRYDHQPRVLHHENKPQKLSQEHHHQAYNYNRDTQSQQHHELENSENDQIEKELESLLIQDTSIKTENVSLFCNVSKNCSSCVTEDVCLWCQSRNRCYSYFNDSLTDLTCPDKQWYRNQCRYKAHTKPCPLRNTSCDDCLSDGLCYWCKSTEQCGYYPHKDYRPPDCPEDDVKIDHCKTYGHLWVVLVPILCIIFIPVILYIIIWLVLCCMKQAGYDPLQPEEEKPKDIEKKKKPIRLQHEAMPSKTDELRKKYGLKNGGNP